MHPICATIFQRCLQIVSAEILQVRIVDLLVGDGSGVAMSWCDDRVGRQSKHLGLDAIDENRKRATEQVGATNAALEHDVASYYH